MFDIGFWELLLILLVALLVIGPERLPGAARSAGLWVRRARALVNLVRDEVDRQVESESTTPAATKASSDEQRERESDT